MEEEERMSTVVTCMGESLIDFVPLHTPGQSGSASDTGESKPVDQEEVLPSSYLSSTDD
jgi:hypothetical protein